MKILVEEKLTDILKLRREQMKMTQGELGEKLGMSAMGLSYLERGTRGLKIELLELWAKELGLDVEIKIKEKVSKIGYMGTSGTEMEDHDY